MKRLVLATLSLILVLVWAATTFKAEVQLLRDQEPAVAHVTFSRVLRGRRLDLSAVERSDGADLPRMVGIVVRSTRRG